MQRRYRRDVLEISLAVDLAPSSRALPRDLGDISAISRRRISGRSRLNLAREQEHGRARAYCRDVIGLQVIDHIGHGVDALRDAPEMRNRAPRCTISRDLARLLHRERETVVVGPDEVGDFLRARIQTLGYNGAQVYGMSRK